MTTENLVYSRFLGLSMDIWGVESQLYHLLAVCYWVFLNLSESQFPLLKNERKITESFWVCCID